MTWPWSNIRNDPITEQATTHTTPTSVTAAARALLS
jgi:hypothetical protein